MSITYKTHRKSRSFSLQILSPVERNNKYNLYTYRSILCLPIIYKVIKSFITQTTYQHWDRKNIILTKLKGWTYTNKKYFQRLLQTADNNSIGKAKLLFLLSIWVDSIDKGSDSWSYLSYIIFQMWWIKTNTI